MTALTYLLKLEQRKLVWISIFLLSTSAMTIALIYQYAFAWEPCVLCVHIRIIMLGIMLLAFIMIFISAYQIPRLLAYFLQNVLAVYLFLKCRELYHVEVGLQEAGCMFSAGLPPWFDLEAWMPALFEVRAACGESPEILFGITMAESLYYASALAMFLSFILTLSSMVNLKTRVA